MQPPFKMTNNTNSFFELFEYNAKKGEPNRGHKHLGEWFVSDQAPSSPVVDPDNVPELVCNGQFNVSVRGNLATLTFTQVRPDAAQMFAQEVMVSQAVVRARIVLPLANLKALVDLLTTATHKWSANSAATATGGSTKHLDGLSCFGSMGRSPRAERILTRASVNLSILHR